MDLTNLPYSNPFNIEDRRGPAHPQSRARPLSGRKDTPLGYWGKYLDRLPEDRPFRFAGLPPEQANKAETPMNPFVMQLLGLNAQSPRGMPWGAGPNQARINGAFSALPPAAFGVPALNPMAGIPLPGGGGSPAGPPRQAADFATGSPAGPPMQAGGNMPMNINSAAQMGGEGFYGGSPETNPNLRPIGRPMPWNGSPFSGFLDKMYERGMSADAGLIPKFVNLFGRMNG